jgi:hypothetical protein
MIKSNAVVTLEISPSVMLRRSSSSRPPGVVTFAAFLFSDCAEKVIYFL